MKLFRSFTTIIMLISLCGCLHMENEVQNEMEMYGIVVEGNSSEFLLISLDDFNMYTIEKEDDFRYNNNDCVEIVYDTVDSNGNIIADSVKKQDYSILSMYLQVIDELMIRDQGLNAYASILSLDINREDITSKDLDIISQILKIRYGFDEILYYNLEELVEEGYINENKSYFDSGLLISIEENNVKEDSFIFNAMKYKGSLAAYYLGECIASKSKNGWIFEIGYEAIS